MRNSSSKIIRNARFAVLSVLAAGMVFSSACSLRDFRHNVIVGTQAFVKGYTTEIWEALVPPADELINVGG